MRHLPQRDRNGMAFGIDSTRKEFFSLRQARYDALADNIAQFSRRKRKEGQRLQLLDIGPFKGTTYMHLQDRDGVENIDVSIAELTLRDDLYRKEEMKTFFIGDLMQGYPEITSDSYDVVVCEQVLEHLSELDIAMKTIARVLKPGGTAIVGVPIFPPGIHLIRRYGQPIWDKIMPFAKKHRGHIQTFSKRDFIKRFESNTALKATHCRGFRTISGGILRFLENYQWYWKMCRASGRLFPSFCIEIQVFFEKPSAPDSVKKMAA